MAAAEYKYSRPGFMQELKAAKYSTRENAVMLCSEAYYEIMRLQNDNDALLRALSLALSPARTPHRPASGGENTGRMFAS